MSMSVQLPTTARIGFENGGTACDVRKLRAVRRKKPAGCRGTTSHMALCGRAVEKEVMRRRVGCWLALVGMGESVSCSANSLVCGVYVWCVLCIVCGRASNMRNEDLEIERFDWRVYGAKPLTG